ncbi:MAG: hypothetical protein L6Q71_01400 [Planctomycetes bacterium]|nr:hypothetical protein [Planctomycetota bacterium]
MSFQKSIFINCPFDDEYLPLLRPLLFTTIYLGFSPRIALERLNSAEPRIHKIISLIEESKYAIHDLSRLKAQKRGEFFRLNMPFELGIDMACRLFKAGRWSGKKCLVLEAERYRYQAAISDLSSSDIAVHNNQPIKVVFEVRNWLNNEARLHAPGPAEVWARFNEFMAANYDVLKARGYSARDIKRLPIAELMTCAEEWVRLHGRRRR